MYGTELLSKVTIKDTSQPDTVEVIHYLFWDKGISLNEFNELPLPYIFSILRAYNYIKELERKEVEKQNKKNKR